MRNAKKLLLLIILMLILAFPATALAASSGHEAWINPQDQVVLGGNYQLQSGQTLEGNLWVFGGTANLEQGSAVTGNVILMGGNLNSDGNVNGSITSTGGSVDLGDHAIVHGNIRLIGGSLSRASGARVEGQVTTENRGPGQVQTPVVNTRVSNPFWSFLSLLFRAFLTAAIAVLVVMFLPKHTERISHTVMTQPLISGGLGLLTIIIVPIALVVIMITIILIPASLLGFLLLALTIVFGWIAIGVEVGQRLAAAFKTEWVLPVSAAVGTFVMTLVADGIGRIPCVGWMVPAIIGLLGLGGVILTRFGTQDYPPYGPAASILPPGPAAPVTPAPPAEPGPYEGPLVYPPDEGPSASGSAIYPAPTEEPPAA
ncbi:MAG: hypothetical protein ACM3PY_05535 [Omnitrophica WOR_2 bacterium]